MSLALVRVGPYRSALRSGSRRFEWPKQLERLCLLVFQLTSKVRAQFGEPRLAFQPNLIHGGIESNALLSFFHSFQALFASAPWTPSDRT